jgi:outer membrane immunogenic protein
MKRLILGVAAAFLLSAGQAAADGLPSKSYVKAPEADASFSWRGFYAGLHAGVATGNTQGFADFGLTGIQTDYDLSGGIYGVQAGYLGQWGNVVAGIEGTYSRSNAEGNTGCGDFILFSLDCRREVNWIATVVGRAGLAYDRVLVYGLGGVAWADVDTNVAVNFIGAGTPLLSGGTTHTGWTAGFGIEWALSNRVSVRAEYAHIDLGSETLNFGGGVSMAPEVRTQLVGDGPSSVRDRVGLEMDTVRLGVNIKLGHND